MDDQKVELENLNTIENLSMSDAFVCDVETGVCGPVNVEEIEEDENKEEESHNENNNMV